jgi:hypothetical protein
MISGINYTTVWPINKGENRDANWPAMLYEWDNPCIPETGNNVHKERHVSRFVPLVTKSHHMNCNQSVTLSTYFSLCSLSFALSVLCLGRHYSSTGKEGKKKICLVLLKLLKNIYFFFLFLQTTANCCSSPLKETLGHTCSFISCVENVHRLETLWVLIFKDFSCKLFKTWAKVSGIGNFSSWAWVLPPPQSSRARWITFWMDKLFC